MPSDAYKLIFRAQHWREQLTFSYRRLPRECCPVILGYAADQREVLFAYQFAGATSSKTKLPNWRCFYVDEIGDLRSRAGRWLEGTSHTQEQKCVRFVDVDVNIPETLTHKRPLPFGSKKLQPPRRG
jgi:hypothetical protein